MNNDCKCNKPNTVGANNLRGCRLLAPKCCKDGVFFNTIVIPKSMGGSSEGEPFAPKNGMYYNALVRYEADDTKFIYDSEGNYTDVSGVSPEEIEEMVNKNVNKKIAQISTDGTLETLVDRYVAPDLTALDSKISNEVLARTNADNALSTRIDNEALARSNADSGLQSQISGLASGSPLAASSTADMTDTSRIYVNTTDGYWYYYDGGSWTAGGVYQSTSIELLSIIGGMIKSNTITKDKLRSVISILGKATDLYPGKALTNFYSGSGPVLTNNAGSNTVVFDVEDVVDQVVYFKIDATTTTGGNNIDKCAYSSTDLTKFSKIHYYQIVANAQEYDSDMGCGAIKRPTNSAYDKVILTLNANWDIFVREPYNKPALITGESVKIDAVDMRSDTNITEGVEVTGYADGSTYLPVEVFNQGFNKILISLTEENINRIKQGYLYVPNPSSTITKRMIMYKENVRGRLITLNNIIQSEGYNPTTKRCNLGILLRNYIDQGYDYIAIYYESNIAETPLYTTYMTSNDPNYSALNQDKDYSLVMPSKIKAVENQTMCFYFQNAIRYQNSDLISYKTFGGATFNNQRVSLLNTSNTGDNTIALTTKKSYLGATTAVNFSYDVVPANAGNGLTKKVLMIGDSLTADGHYTERLLNLFSNDVMNIQLLGTMQKSGQPLNRYEGRGGWGTTDYTTNSTYAGYTNPFWNPAESKFDFAYYMSEQGYTGVDYVFINLGTNDLTIQPTNTINNLNTMIASIKDYDSNIKIGLWLPPLRGVSKEVSTNYLNDLFEAMRVNKLYIDTYTSNSDVYLIPVCYNVNPYEDYRTHHVITSDTDAEYGIDVVSDKTHPNLNGYYHIGDVIFAWIKYFATL